MLARDNWVGLAGAVNLPDLEHPAYCELSPFYRAGFGGQCTGYVWGRVREKLGISLPFSGHAQTWWNGAEDKFGFLVGF